MKSHWHGSALFTIPLIQSDYLSKSSIKTNLGTDKGNSQNETWHWTNDEIGVALYKVGSECELNPWSDRSLGQSVWTESSGRGFKSHSGQLSLATSKNSSVVNTICINLFRYTHVITSAKFRLKQTWRLMKAIAEMKYDTKQAMKLE